jgi:hypothetical protein
MGNVTMFFDWYYRRVVAFGGSGQDGPGRCSLLNRQWEAAHFLGKFVCVTWNVVDKRHMMGTK